MEYRTLGSSNLKTSRLWLGGMSFGDPKIRPWTVDAATSRRIMDRALEHGINVIDTCDAYCQGLSEEIIGAHVAERGGRGALVLATKLGLSITPKSGPNGAGYSRKHIIEACEASLRRLKTDYIDIYQTHIWQPASNVDEVVAAFDRLVQDGKVLYAGATDMPAWQLAKAVYGARHRGQAAFISMQHHFNAIWREDERELMPFCRAEGLGLVPYSPIGRGFLSGVGRQSQRQRTDEMITRWYDRPADVTVAEAIAAVAREIGRPAASVALAWVLGTPGVTATVVGPTTPEQMDELAANLDLALTPEQMKAIAAPYAFRASKGHG